MPKYPGVVVDYSWARPDLAQLAQYFAGIVRYVGDDTTASHGKLIFRPEYDTALAAGLSVTLVCEQGNQPALGGFSAGVHDATVSNNMADALAHPADIIYVLEDPTKLPVGSWGTVELYLRGVISVGRRGHRGYGSRALIEHLVSLSLLPPTGNWQVQGWSSGQSSTASLTQLVGFTVVHPFGKSIDQNDVLGPNYAQHPGTTAVKSGDDMNTDRTLVVAEFNVAGTNGGVGCKLTADGGIRSFGDFDPTQLRYKAISTIATDGDYNYGPGILYGGQQGVFSYPGLVNATAATATPEVDTFPARQFEAMYVISYRGISVEEHVGPAGPAGAAGPQGTPGSTGATGAQGAAGRGMSVAVVADLSKLAKDAGGT